ncbi:50S ribosomal protein L25, partial [Plasticicumulans sp.]|uniref:50S ribosomal protein L25 n=1 Tax=Plasticicumulans sp. TaxID=2307179 RepID=UPI00395BFD94
MSVVAFELNAETRNEQGKGASRRLRIAGRVPAVLYGAGKAPELLSVSQRDILLQLENEAFYSHVLDLKIGDRAERVVLRDLQRHPYKPMVLHLDLQRVDATQQITVHVPLHFVNQEAAIGVKQQGGVVSHHL